EGDVLAAFLRNGIEYADVVHACRIAGIYYCPVNWHFTATEIDYILADSGARALITSQDLLDGLKGELYADLPRRVAHAREPEQD
ncbi:AMP-binding protein, partial [Klebsiella pneumoniae]